MDESSDIEVMVMDWSSCRRHEWSEMAWVNGQGCFSAGLPYNPGA